MRDNNNHHNYNNHRDDDDDDDRLASRERPIGSRERRVAPFQLHDHHGYIHSTDLSPAVISRALM